MDFRGESCESAVVSNCVFTLPLVGMFASQNSGTNLEELECPPLFITSSNTHEAMMGGAE